MSQERVINHRQGQTKNTTAVIFVHGFLGHPGKTWGKFPHYLVEHPAMKHWDVYSIGYPTSAWFDLAGIWKANPDVAGIATSLKSILQQDSTFSEYKALSIVAHSMGGLAVQRALLDDPKLRARIDSMFLFGTPSGGLQKATFFRFWKRSLRDMEFGGEFIVKLRDDWQRTFSRKLPFRMKVIAGNQDEFVPRHSSLDPFAEDHREVIKGDHLSIVKPLAPTDLSLQIVVKELARGAAAAEASAAYAAERSAFRATVDRLSPQRATLDQKGLVDLALALEQLGDDEDALNVLSIARPNDYDARGALAGRYKRRWYATSSAGDAHQALSVYGSAFALASAANAHRDAFYNGINYAFMTLAHKDDLREAQKIARQVLTHCTAAESDERTVIQWLRATEGEAQLILRDPARATQKYRHAFEATDSPREHDSAFQQAVKINSIFHDRATANNIRRVFKR